MSIKQKALGVISNKYKEPKICENCGNEFGCGVSLTGCWCMKVKLTDENRAELKEKFKNCLCPDCLESIANGKGLVVTE